MKNRSRTLIAVVNRLKIINWYRNITVFHVIRTTVILVCSNGSYNNLKSPPPRSGIF